MEHVVLFDLFGPEDQYVHRVGRTGRVCNKGHSVAFFSPNQEEDRRWAPALYRVSLLPDLSLIEAVYVRPMMNIICLVPRAERLVDSAVPLGLHRRLMRATWCLQALFRLIGTLLRRIMESKPFLNTTIRYGQV